MVAASIYDNCPKLKPHKSRSLKPEIEQELHKFQQKIENKFKQSQLLTYKMIRPR